MREYTGNVLSILAIVLMIPGCFHKQQNVSKAALNQKQAAFSFNTLETNIDVAASNSDSNEYNPEVEAKLNDIPTMVGSMPVQIDSEYTLPYGQLMLAFVCPFDQEMVSNFYNFEMENVGWHRITMIKGFESTLVFQKPRKICIVSIRSIIAKNRKNNSCLVHICTSHKEK